MLRAAAIDVKDLLQINVPCLLIDFHVVKFFVIGLGVMTLIIGL